MLSVHGIFQARILQWVAISFSRDFPTQGSNPGLLQCRQILYWLSNIQRYLLFLILLQFMSVQHRNSESIIFYHFHQKRKIYVSWFYNCKHCPTDYISNQKNLHFDENQIPHLEFLHDWRLEKFSIDWLLTFTFYSFCLLHKPHICRNRGCGRCS